MAKVRLTIDGVAYDLACEDGAEPQLQALAAMVDRKARELAAEGAARDQRLLLLTSLRIADELAYAVARAEAAETAAAQLRVDLEAVQSKAAQVVETAVRHIEAIATRLE